MTAPALDKPDYDVLNVVVLKKMASTPAITEICGSSANAVDATLTRLAERGLVVVAAGSALPTDDAEATLDAAAADYYATVRDDAGMTELVDRFETTNAQFLKTMSAWQQVDVGGRKVANDHSDAEYDDKIIGRLDKLVSRLGPLIDALAAHDPRFATYGTRFTATMQSIEEGDHELVSSPTRDSVHNIWFEFHEDLLRTLGRERTE